MFKTNSRRSLSLTAVVALAGSLFAGTPAMADGEVSLAASSGTTYNAVAGTTFALTLNAGATIPSSSWNTLKTKITNTGETTYSATATAASGSVSGQVSGTTSGTIIKYGTAPTTSSVVTLNLSTANSVSAATLTVQSWLDSNGNDLIDDAFVSAVRTVSFVKLGDITWTTAFTPVVASPSTVTLSAVISNNKEINASQLSTGYLKVAFATVSGTAYTAIGAASHSAGAFTDGETASAVATATTTAKAEKSGVTVVAGQTYVAVAVVNGVEAGSEVYSVVSAANVSTISTPVITAGADAKVDSANSTVREGATSVTFTAQVSKSAGVAPAAGTSVKVTVTEGSNMTVSSTVTGGGVTLKNASSTTTEKIEFNVTTDAAGKVSVPLTLAGMEDGMTFTVKLTAESVETATNTVTIAATDDSNALVDLNTVGSGAVLKVAAGSTYTLKWGALDNFGQALKGDYRIKLTNAGATATVSANLVDGVASFTVTDDTTKTEGQFTATLEVYSKASLAYVSAGATANITPTIGASNAVASITLTASSASNLVLNNSALKAADGRMGATAPTLTTGNRATLSGTVLDANGVATYGSVTLSGPNLMFKVGDLYTLGSATVQTSASGAYDGVVVYSNTAGAVTVSATVGSVKKDLGLTFVAAADTAGARWIVTAPSYALPGSTIQVKAKLVDTWSNPVQVTTTSKIAVTYTGAGFVTGTLPNTTNADGELSFSVLLGSADSGTATVKFAYDGDATSTTTTDNVATTATMTIGKAPVAPAAAKLTVGSFKGFLAIYASGYEGKKLSYKVAGKWGSVASLKAFERVVRKTGAGYTVKVDLYVDGSLVKSETVTTK